MATLCAAGDNNLTNNVKCLMFKKIYFKIVKTQARRSGLIWYIKRPKYYHYGN